MCVGFLSSLQALIYKVQASKPSGYRFGLSRNVSIFNLNQYCKLHIEFLHPLQYTLYNPLQHPPLWSPSWVAAACMVDRMEETVELRVVVAVGSWVAAA